MTSSHLAILDRRTGVARSAALIGAGFALVALALGVSVAVVNADGGGEESRPVNATVQRAAQTPPPARVILPAPWEQAAPAQSAAAPAKPADRR